MSAKPKGGFRPGSGRKLRGAATVSVTFTEAESAWIAAVCASSKIASDEIKRGTAELMVTAMRLGRYVAKLEATGQVSQDDAKAFAAAFGRYLKAISVLGLDKPPPLENPFDPPKPKPAEPASAPDDALMKEIAG